MTGSHGDALPPWRVAVLTSAPDRRVPPAIRAAVRVADAGSCGAVIAGVLVAAAPDAPGAAGVLDAVDGRVPVAFVDPRVRRRAGDPHWRAAHERAVLDALDAWDVDAALLLGYGLIAGPTLLDALPMVNLHPGVPGGPVGTERAVIDELLASGATETGVFAHVVTPELDRGPVVASLRAPMPQRSTTWPRSANRPRQVADVHGALLADVAVAALAAVPDVLAGSAAGPTARGSSACASPGTR